ncbi:hypothetical protein GCM10023185_29530 [Hymenobacter saemangeumensis]|uniref:DUF4249 domain-containing protein n=1 Tax=Hymenobacter saemangeumensis TaxID=1084522 RepID=A0ABP8IL07_9BACT
MKRILFFLFAAFISLSLSSCLDVVEIDIPEGKPLLVVEGQVTDQPAPAWVKLSMTQAYFADALPPVVRGASISLLDDQGRRDVLRETTPGLYVGSGAVQGRVGGRYTLTIEANGQSYQAETEIKRTPEIDSVSLEYMRGHSFFKDGYYAFYNGPELPGVGDYYRFKVTKNGKLFNDPGDLIVRADELVDGNYIGRVQLVDEPLVRGDKLKVELNAIPRDYFYFLNEMFGQINNVGLFATTPANVRTNIRNTRADADKSAVGYFAGFTVRTDSVTVR